MAGFQLSINGRFWVSTEVRNSTRDRPCGAQMVLGVLTGWLERRERKATMRRKRKA